jgi:hypothetical protein
MFKRRRSPVDVILLCVRWYCKHGISYRDLVEMMQERGVEVGTRRRSLLSSELFEDGVESVFCLVGDQEGLTAVTTEGDEGRRAWLCRQFRSHPSQKREGWRTRSFVFGSKVEGWATRRRLFSG